MIVYFADRKMNIVGLASTALPKSLQILDDKRTEELKTGSVSLSFEVVYDGEQGYESIKDTVAEGNYVLLYDGENCEYYTIINTELNTEDCTVTVYAEGVGLDLLNEIVGAYSGQRIVQPYQNTVMGRREHGHRASAEPCGAVRRRTVIQLRIRGARS